MDIHYSLKQALQGLSFARAVRSSKDFVPVLPPHPGLKTPLTYLEGILLFNLTMDNLEQSSDDVGEYQTVADYDLDDQEVQQTA